MVSPVEHLSFTVKMVTIFILPPEWEVHVPSNMMNIHTNILTKVCNSLFRIALRSCVTHFEFSRSLCHFGGICLIDDFTVGEHVRSNFIQRWQNNSCGNWVMDNSRVESIDEYSFIHSLTEISSIITEAWIPCFTVSKTSNNIRA